MTEEVELNLPRVELALDHSERRRRRALEVMTASGVAFAPLLLGSIFGQVHSLAALFFVGALVTPYVALWGLYQLHQSHQGRLRFAPASLTVSGGALDVTTKGGFTRRLHFNQLGQGSWDQNTTLRLRTHQGDDVVLRVGARDDGEAILRAARVTARHRSFRAPLASAAARFPGVAALAGLLLAAIIPVAVIALMRLGTALRDLGGAGAGAAPSAGDIVAALALTACAGLSGFSLIRALLRREAVVGTDGVVFRGAFGRRFIPYRGVASIERHPRGVSLVLEAGEPIVLPVAAGDERDALLDRIREAMTASSGEAAARVNLERLDRRGRELHAWKADLLKLLPTELDYRSSALQPGELGAVIEDGSAPLERRVAAAVALRAREPDEARRRVRIAVSAAADEDLRGALERAAEGEIDEAALPNQREGERARDETS